MFSKGLKAALAALLAVAAAPAFARPAPIDQVVATERAFADFTREHGLRTGFLAFIAPDGWGFHPQPSPSRPGIEAEPETAEGPPLHWWPLFAGVANSGDLGFTTGGVNRPTRYFTVWQRQADGRWRWIYDGGIPMRESIAGAAGDPVMRVPAATASAGSAERALAEVAPLETELARAAETDAAAARLRFLASDGLAAGSPMASVPGREGQAAELARQPARLTMRSLGGLASRAGDMAFTWGELRWTRQDQPRWGHYARIWQKRREGWRIVADMLIAAPGVPPAS